MTLTPQQKDWHQERLDIATAAARPANEVDWDSGQWPNFTPYEVACRGTGLLYINPGAMDMLQAFRDRLGAAFTPTSAFRSPAHNRAIGGAARSMHLLGIAFDIPAVAPIEEMAILAREVGFKAIGRYTSRGFIHLDARTWGASWGS